MEAAQQFNVEEAKPGGFWIRVAAAIIDALVLSPVSVYAGMFVSEPNVYLALAMATLAYKPLMEGTIGATVGKLVLGLRVVNENGGGIGLVGALMRSLLISIVPAVLGALLQMRLLNAGLFRSQDPEALQAFMRDQAVLYIALLAASLVALISCIVVATNARKRGWHDMMADTFVIQKST